jgi:hypothetical protein
MFVLVHFCLSELGCALHFYRMEFMTILNNVRFLVSEFKYEYEKNIY